ncbi:sugar phosphate isomerases/epimerases [Clostridium aceticum]|uniref:Sugar phosphate isomerases/epimerases n=1 Tax=Clostridium aceticum TaxID=84022 RepID=A0A0D8IAP2_9CLOT|nr:sugar phosphate isomerase/epimerase family protein [Clostridium aceticum]AKL97279.1 sugar phosphate isomerases/epimerases [Clostridium aceticum]KJF26301.1 hypothetical protein TZ02_14110 [Clostridium aceticum]
MKNIYISSNLMWDASLEEMFQVVETYGLGGIEFWAQHMEAKDYDIEVCRNKLEQYQLACIVHGKSWDLNIASLNKEIRKTSLMEIKSSIDLAAKLGAKEVTIHPPRETIGGDRETCVKLAKQGLKELIAYGEENEINISLEIMENIPKELITNATELIEVMGEEYKRISYTLDLAHCESIEAFNILHDALYQVSKIHISNRQGNKLHTPLSKGDYNFYELMPLLESKKVPLVIEGFERGNEFKDLKENINLLKKIKEDLPCL